MDAAKKRRILKIAGCLCVLLILSQFIGISTAGAFTEGGGCFSVVFDKAFVLGADRIVIRKGAKTVTITDKALVREIASEFVVANRTDLCGYYADKWMEIYNGDQLVRSIRWNACCELAEIYEADAFRWVFPSYSNVGQVELSREFMKRLDQIIAAQDS